MVIGAGGPDANADVSHLEGTPVICGSVCRSVSHVAAANSEPGRGGNSRRVALIDERFRGGMIALLPKVHQEHLDFLCVGSPEREANAATVLLRTQAARMIEVINLVCAGEGKRSPA